MTKRNTLKRWTISDRTFRKRRKSSWKRTPRKPGKQLHVLRKIRQKEQTDSETETAETAADSREEDPGRLKRKPG